MITDLANKWIFATEEQLRGKQLHGENEEAVVELLQLCADHPERAVQTIADIIANNPREDVLLCLGAGPIEDLLNKNASNFDLLLSKVSSKIDLGICLTSVDIYREGASIVSQIEQFIILSRTSALNHQKQ